MTETSQGIKSLEAAISVFSALARREGPVSLTELARTCAMQPSTVHRYLVTFQRTGLVRQDRGSGRYDLGREALQIGLAAIARHEFVAEAADRLAELSDATGMTAMISVWGSMGATVIRWERGPMPTVSSIGLGSRLPLLYSASGRVFLAWARPELVQRHLAKEMRHLSRNPRLCPDFTCTAKGVADLAARIREAGHAAIGSHYIPGLVSVAAPVLDWQHEPQLAVTLVGTDPEAIIPGADPLRHLAAFCAELSAVRPGVSDR